MLRHYSEAQCGSTNENSTRRCRFLVSLTHWLLLGSAFDEILELDGLTTFYGGDWRNGAVLHGENCHFRILAVSLGIELDVAACTVILDCSERRKIFGRINRVRCLHRGDQQV